METHHFSASLEEIKTVHNCVRQFVARSPYSPLLPSLCREIEQMIEEPFVNIILHGYAASVLKRGMDIEMQLRWMHRREELYLQITLKDRGVAFNPLQFVPQVRKEASLEERQIGGWGIYFFRHLADRLYYTRREGLNRLSLEKKIR